jgi:hypothetical protein
MIWIPGFVRRSLYQKNQTIPHKNSAGKISQNNLLMMSLESHLHPLTP